MEGIRTFVSAALLLLALAGAAEAQRRDHGAATGSAEANYRLWKYRQGLQGASRSDELHLAGLGIDASGKPSFTGKVIQVVSKDRMLVEVRDARTAEGTQFVMVVAPTAGF